LSVVFLAIVFAGIYSWFFVSAYWQAVIVGEGRYIFSWPDAMANNFFIDNFINKSNFNLPEPLNPAVNNIIHPRSTNVIETGDIVPMGFLGFPLTYGLIGQLIGAIFVKFLTPIFAAGAGIFFYLIIKKIFDERVSLISTILFYTLATYWYYSSLVMLSSVFFIFLLLAGIYFYLRQNAKIIFGALSGLFFGLALITRAVEFIPIALIIGLLTFFFRTEFNFKKGIVFLFCLLAPIGLLCYVNYLTYGNAFTLGYLNSNSDLSFFERLPLEMQIKSDATAGLNLLKFIFVPFGLHELKIFENFYFYFLRLLWPYVALFSVGLGLMIRERRRGRFEQRQVVYGVVGAAVSIWLFFYYGNWNFADLMVIKNNTIGSSYARYWLLPNIAILPFIGYVLYCLWQAGSTLFEKIALRAATAVVIICLIWFSAEKVYYTRGDGLIDQKEIIAEHYVAAGKVEFLVPKNAILITDRTDKLFFPDYRVVDFNLNYEIFPQLKKIIGQVPVFYLSARPERDMDYINEKKIARLNLRFVNFSAIDDELTLFQLKQF
jgi:hypothetical protein